MVSVEGAEVLPVSRVARLLLESLGPTAVAVLAGTRDRRAPYVWARLEGPVPGLVEAQRLRAALEVWDVLCGDESADVARAWFVGCNPRLGDVQPIMALREDRAADVLAAARALVGGTDSW